MKAGDDLAPRKSLGQHWLTDETSLEAIVEVADITASDYIVEIGPGTGALTKLLSKEAKQVLAIELDDQLVKYLKTLNISNLTIENTDVLKFNFESLPKYKIVANIPYFLTGKIIRLISELNNRPELVVLLVQKEIAEKLSARPGGLSILGLTAQYFWHIEPGLVVTSDKFDPPPKVDSQVVKLTPKPLTMSKADQQALFRLIKIGFSSKRKTILNNLSAGLRADKQSIEEVLKTLDIKPDRRPQTISLGDWAALLTILEQQSLVVA